MKNSLFGSLAPTSEEIIKLPNGIEVAIPKAIVTLAPWLGKHPGDTYGGKAILKFGNRPAFAELLILWTLQKHGWSGVWIDSFRRCFRDGFWGNRPRKNLKGASAARLSKLLHNPKTRAWDVYCWRGKRVIFVEAKRIGKDHIRLTQVNFLQAALAAGYKESNFLLVEWDLLTTTRQTKRPPTSPAR